MTHDDIAELLGAYALDAVDGDERAAVEEHLATCARCRAEVQDHREVAALLGNGGAAAPEGVWSRIAETLESAPPRLRLAPVPVPAEPPRRTVPRRLAVAAVAAAAVVVALLGVQVRRQDQRIDSLQAALADPLVPAFDAALDDPDSEVFELASAGGDVVLRGAVTEEGVGYLRATALPRLDPDRTYQLWGAAGDELLSLGVLGADPGVVSFRAAGYEALAITAESAPGVVQSENPPVVSGAVT